MKRCILISGLSVESIPQKKYQVKLSLIDGYYYFMNTANKEIYKYIRHLSFKCLKEEEDYDKIIHIAKKILNANDVFFDEIEIP